MKFIIQGGNKLKGEISVMGAKNAALKMIAASVLFNGEVVLNNVPDILDIRNLQNILEKNGAVFLRSGNQLKIDTSKLTNHDPDPVLVEKMRGSIVLIGPYLARFGQIGLPQPGGCAIGCRPIDIHLHVFKEFGVDIKKEENNFYQFKVEKLKAGKISFDKISVTATENAILAAVLTEGETEISHAACEPEITDLIKFLNRAGAKIDGEGTNNLKITGVEKLNKIEYTVMPDKIEAATFITLGLMTDSQITVNGLRIEDIQIFLDKLTEIGASFESGENFVKIKNTQNLKAFEIETAVYPGFATDWQALMGLIATKTEGQSKINETIFENRLGYLKELQNMGANIEILNKHEALVNGPTSLKGAQIESLDLRAGATLVIAGLAANGKTIIEEAQIVDRGYEKIEERLQKLGAQITREL